MAHRVSSTLGESTAVANEGAVKVSMAGRNGKEVIVVGGSLVSEENEERRIWWGLSWKSRYDGAVGVVCRPSAKDVECLTVVLVSDVQRVVANVAGVAALVRGWVSTVLAGSHFITAGWLYSVISYPQVM